MKKKNKQKREGFDAVVKEKLVDENEEEVTPRVLTLTKRHERKRKRKEDISEALSEDASFSQPKKKKKKANILNDTIDDTANGTETGKGNTDSTLDSTVKKKYILFIGELSLCFASCTFCNITTVRCCR